MKTDMLTVRISPELKKESEQLFSEMGLSTSYAITVFLQQAVNRREIPFRIEAKKPHSIDAGRLAQIINSTAGKEKVNPHLEKIIRLLDEGDIDYETAKFAVKRYFAQ
jgi:DNA-damage-inducible protein J